MTAAEQVACDALRSAGLDELADNLEWLKQAAALRSYLRVVGGDTPSLEGLIDTAAYLDPTK